MANQEKLAFSDRVGRETREALKKEKLRSESIEADFSTALEEVSTLRAGLERDTPLCCYGTCSINIDVLTQQQQVKCLRLTMPMYYCCQ